ncbi:helix-turn-helix domain-containing protein [Butyribacter sp.]|uniref:helix-turn-helix domain-containing protein n=1 Tax=Butyribacter sp. TaxID=2822465 RepID=UPI002A9B3C4E|nr:helix-turn-helix domain-containing protein [Lachnoclostridium sp.]MDY5180148.1 helix-turn-helix domain-containing protein [Butyribacter sp.]
MLEQSQENYQDNYISVDEAAQYLGIKPVTLRSWIKKTDIPTRKIGKQWKFKRSELDEWVNSGRANFE